MNDAERRQVVAIALELADLVDRRSVLFTSRGEFAIRQYGAAGLGRGCGLMRAAIVCHEAGQDESVGVLVRAVMESWVSGAFVLFGGPDALARLDAEFQRQQKILLESNRINASDVIAQQKAELDEVARKYGISLGEDGEPHFDRLPVEVMAKELGTLIEAATGDAEDALALYNLLYRPYSTLDSHGLQPLERQLDLSDLALTTMRKPQPWIDAGGSIAIACLLLTRLAKWVFSAYRIGTWDVERIFETVAPIVERASATALARSSQQVLDALPHDIPRPGGSAP